MNERKKEETDWNTDREKFSKSEPVWQFKSLTDVTNAHSFSSNKINIEQSIYIPLRHRIFF